jgi:hypothetical protein
MKPEQVFRIIIIAAGLAGLILQFQISTGMLAARGLGLGATLWKLSGYFTILTNGLLVLTQSLCLLPSGSRYRSASVQGALLLYILVVGIVYVVLLADLWKPEGRQWWADNLLHRVTPLLQLGFWIAFVPKDILPWRQALPWLAWPAAYLIWTLARGPAYPYPFLEADRLGWPRTILNCLLMTAAFSVGALAIIGGGRALAKKPG